MKAVSKAIFILFFCILFVKVSFAQEQISPTLTVPSINTSAQKNSENNIDSALSEFHDLNWKARKLKFPILLTQIEQLTSRPDKDLLLARLYLMVQGDNKEYLEKAYLLTENFLRKNPKSFNGYLILATACTDKMSTDTYFEDPSKWINKDDIKLREQALQAIDMSLAINDKYAEAYKLKATLNEGEEKIHLLEKAISLNQSYNDAWYELIDTLISMKRYDEAEIKFTASIKNHLSKEETIKFSLIGAKFYREIKNYNEAINLAQIALSVRKETGSDGLNMLYSGVDDIYSSLAKSYLEEKDYIKAEFYLKKYLELHPKDILTRLDLADLYREQGEKNQAIVQYEQILSYGEQPLGNSGYTILTPSSAIYNLGLLYKDSDKERAKELFTKYIKLTIDDNTEDSEKWVSRAKDNLNDLGVYEYPKSKKELNDAKFEKIKIIFAILILFLLIFLSWKFKKVTKLVILSLMVLAIVIISLIEANEGEPSFVRAILYFIPVMSIGGFFLYLLRNRK